MKKNPHIFYKIAALLVGVWTLSSCTKDDFADCPVEVRVYFNTLGQPINPADVDRMHLYVFNQSGLFVGEYRDDRITHFGPDYYINVSDLYADNYRFIAWGGKDERFYATTPTRFVKGQTTISEALLALEHPGNSLTTPVHHLFHAMLSANVPATMGIHRIDLPLVQLTNTINIRTVGLPDYPDSFLFRITDNNCVYQFDRSYATHTHEPVTFSAACTKDNDNQLHATLNVLRLSADRRTPQLEVYNQTAGAPLYPVGEQSGDLIGLILSAYPQNNFETTHTYDIVLTFSGDATTGFTVDVSVNGWLVNDEKNELID